MEVDFRQAFENAPVGLVVGRNRVILACNHAFARIFRGSMDDLVGQTFERSTPRNPTTRKPGSASARACPGSSAIPTIA